MNGEIFPVFEHEHILRTEMLTQMRNYTYEYARIMNSNLSNGIICGCAIDTTASELIVNRGLINYEGRVYLLKEPIVVHYEPTDVYCALKFRFKSEKNQQGCSYRELEIFMADCLAEKPGEFELCRFKLKKGSKLRSQYVDLADYDTEFDTVNIIYSEFAGSNKSSLAPSFLKAFADEAMKYELAELDRCFVLQAMDTSRVMARDTIIAYLALRLQKRFKDYTNKELFMMLCDALEVIRDNGDRELQLHQTKNRGIMMD